MNTLVIRISGSGLGVCVLIRHRVSQRNVDSIAKPSLTLPSCLPMGKGGVRVRLRAPMHKESV